ncbi:response regulator [Marinagarivorans algicola]|uniref:response regulator n=1 Tax=Marinagarivorans algicola TaxID=1513270 RepID=UPI0006B46843|nr:response regulator [Marinagarivorans algicola]
MVSADKQVSYQMPVICVVDDSDDDVLALKRSLRRLEINNPLIHFAQAEKALAYLTDEKSKQSMIGLLLLDINLPGKDGISLLQSLRQSLQYVPAVMLTTSDAPRDIQRSYQAGANAFVTKPLNSAGFMQAIDHIIAFWLQTARLPLSCFEAIE